MIPVPRPKESNEKEEKKHKTNFCSIITLNRKHKTDIGELEIWLSGKAGPWVYIVSSAAEKKKERREERKEGMKQM